MTSTWALQHVESLTGRPGRRITRAVGAALKRAFAGRATAAAPADLEAEDRRRALRHVVMFAGNSNQNLLDVRWGEPASVDPGRGRPADSRRG